MFMALSGCSFAAVPLKSYSLAFSCKSVVMYSFCFDLNILHCEVNCLECGLWNWKIFVRRTVLEYRYQKTVTVVRAKTVMPYVLGDTNLNIDR